MKLSKKINKIDLIHRLLNRGVETIIDKESLEKTLLSNKKLRVKFGIDPTSPNLHLGRAVPLRKLRDFQLLGHQIVLIIGDFTAQIGDPSDKLAKRPMLENKQIKEYLKSYKKQLEKILDLDKVEIVYNSKWLKKLGFDEVCALAENFSVQQMLERRNFKDRFLNHVEISLREFMYPLMQGYDSLKIKADIEIGGGDQLFNLMAGRTLQKAYHEKEQIVMTLEMLEGTDGRKMSSSWGNVISLLDSPYDMFGKIMRVNDDLIMKYFYLATDVADEDLKSLEEMVKRSPKEAKMVLGEEIVSLYYGNVLALEAKEEFEKVFSKKELPKDIEEIRLHDKEISALDLIVKARLVSSKSEGRRLIEQGGLEIDGVNINNPQQVFSSSKDGLVIKAGKRRFAKIILG